MTVILDHTIVLTRDKLSSALFLSHILGRTYGGKFARFAPVKLDDELNLDFADVDRDDFERRTFNLIVTDDEFDGIQKRLEQEGVAYGSEPDQIGNAMLNSRGGGRGLFFRDRNGHTFGVSTAATHLV